MRNNLVLMALLTFWLVAAASVEAGGAGLDAIRQNFPKVADFEGPREDLSGEYRYLAVSPRDWTAGVLYPHTRSWSGDGRWLFFSAIPSIQQDHIARGDLWILAADMEEEEIFHLATIPNPGEFPNKQIFNQADVAPEAGWLVYFNRNDNSIHLLNLITGEEREVFRESTGFLGEPPSITPDGKQIAWFSVFEGPSGEWFKNRTVGVFYMDIDPERGAPAGPAQLVYSLPAMAVPGAEGFRNHVIASHVQINPADPDWIAYCRGSYAPTDGSVMLSRTWRVHASGYPNRMLAHTPKGRTHTHEIWSDDGEWMYLIDTGSLARIPAEGGEIETVISAEQLHEKGKALGFDNEFVPFLSPTGLHLSVSRDNSRIAYDSRLHEKRPKSTTDYENYPVEIWGYDVDEDSLRHLATVLHNERLHAHSHPKVSPDGSRVSFTWTEGLRVGVGVVDWPGE